MQNCAGLEFRAKVMNLPFQKSALQVLLTKWVLTELIS